MCDPQAYNIRETLEKIQKKNPFAVGMQLKHQTRASLLLLALVSLWVGMRMFRMPIDANVYIRVNDAPVTGAVPGTASVGVVAAAANPGGSRSVLSAPAPAAAAAVVAAVAPAPAVNCTEEVLYATQYPNSPRSRVNLAALPAINCPRVVQPPPPPPVKCPTLPPPAPAAAPAACPKCPVIAELNIPVTSAPPSFVCPEFKCVDSPPRILPAGVNLPTFNPLNLPTCANAPAIMLRTPPDVPAAASDPTSTNRIVVPAFRKPAVLPPSSAKTEYRCFTSADWAEICEYNLLCTDGDRAVFIDDSKEAGSKVWSHWGVGDDPVGSHTFDVFPRPPPPTQGA